MVVRINVNATVHTPMYAIDKRMYMKLKLDDTSRQKLDDHHKKEAAKYKMICPPSKLQHDILQLKIPWRYNRVMCIVNGLTPVEDMLENHSVVCTIEFCGSFTLGMFWKIFSISSAENQV